MQTALHYSKAPIIEAIIDLRVAPVDSFDAQQFASLRNAFGEQTRVERLAVNQFQIEFGKGAGEPKAEHTEQATGFAFTCADDRQLLQARLDGFTFVQRAPYQHWELFRDEARRLWNEYRTVYSVNGVTRVALRYINRIDMPLDSNGKVSLNDYLYALPHAPFVDADSQGRGFFMQVQLHQADLGCELIFNEAIVPPPVENTISVVLDFDLFLERFDKPWQPDEDAQVWDFLEKLRVRKNELFQSSITPMLKERIR